MRCQYHTHSKTCYQYDPNQCRFELGKDKPIRPITTIDPTTGEVTLRCLHGLVNNFNETILGILHYQVPRFWSINQSHCILYHRLHHTAYAALELAYKKLGEVGSDDDNVTLRAK